MRTLLAIIYSLMNLVGCTDAQNRSIVVSSKENGVVTLDSVTQVERGRAEFQCRASRTGKCHYVVFDKGEMVADFTLAVAGRHRADGLPVDFGQCVATEAGRVDAQCKPL